MLIEEGQTRTTMAPLDWLLVGHKHLQIRVIRNKKVCMMILEMHMATH